VREGYDLAIRATPAFVVPGSESLVTRKLVSSKLHLAGSAASSKQVDSLDDLKGQPFVLFRQPSLHQELELTTTSGRRHRVVVEGRFVVHDYGSMAALVSKGVGYGLMPLMHIEHSRSALQCILPKLCAETRDIALVYPSRQLPRRVSLLIEHLSRKLGESKLTIRGE
jgi:DNA-binding transcriptional LysR family regulator